MDERTHNVESPLRQVESESHQARNSLRLDMWQKLHHIFAKDDPTRSPIEFSDDDQALPSRDRQFLSKRGQRSLRAKIVELPRQSTFRRQNSERRDRLLPVEPGHAERRAVSVDRRMSTSLPRPRATSPLPYLDPARVSAPPVTNTTRADAGTASCRIDAIPPSLDNIEDIWPQDDHRSPKPPSTTSSDGSHYTDILNLEYEANLEAELESRWILNLSMHFRDKFDREKYFVSYAETPNHWRRVTISCDYRNAEPGSLEMSLKELQYQRDKSRHIYESIRDSLPEIQFYDTVTNLKLDTTDGRLHVHVTEDVNEIIPYPARNTVAHILNDEEFHPLELRESELVFDSHLSGFNYKVRYKGEIYFKKEIPGPDAVDEFLYEINTLHALYGSHHAIQLKAIVLDDTQQYVKGLLISYASGAIVDLLYDYRGLTSWEYRGKWAKQVVRGLSEIHEEGYVKIIDSDIRGCPVGWEPPESATKIASNPRISNYIGEKSDVFQLGMTPRWPIAKNLSFTNPWSKKGSPQDIIRSYLPLKIQGQEEAAVADTGAQENVISETLVRKLKLTVHKTETESHQFINAIGKSMSAIGYANVRCNFEDGPQDGIESKFWVFPKLKIPLVVGRRFLELTGTLTSFRHRLRDKIAPKGVSLRVLHMELPRWRLNCRIGEEMVLANPDTGSDLDLMSRLFVEQSGFKIHKLMSENQYVEFADGERIRLSGVVYVPFTIGSKSKEENLREFYVLDGLTSDVLLGNSTLIELDAFNAYRGELVDIEEYDHFCDFHFIRWAQKTECGNFLDAAFSDFDFSYHNTGEREAVIDLILANQDRLCF